MKKTIIAACLGIAFLGMGCSKTPPAPTAATNPPAPFSGVGDWKVYQNGEHGFSLKYPDTVKLEEVLPKDVGIANYLAVRFTSENGDQMQVYVNPGGHGGPCTGAESSPSRVSRNIGGTNIEGESCGSTEDYSLVHGGDDFFIVLQGNSENQNVFHQMLDSFSFISQAAHTAPTWQWSVVSETTSTKSIKAQLTTATSTHGFTFAYPKNTVGFQPGNATEDDGSGSFTLDLLSPAGTKPPAGTDLTINAGPWFCQFGPENEYMNHSDAAGTKVLAGQSLDYAVAAYGNPGGNDQAGETYSGNVDGICYVMPLFSDRTIPQDAYNKNVAAMRLVLQTIKFF